MIVSRDLSIRKRFLLHDTEIFPLIGDLVWYRNGLIAAGRDADDVDEILLLVMDCYDAKNKQNTDKSFGGSRGGSLLLLW